MTFLRVGTRESALAMRQSQLVIDELQSYYPQMDIRLVPMKTTGDKILDVALSKIGEKGLFTKELEIALMQGEIDIAVHSLKDLPTELPAGCELLAITRRTDYHDVLVANGDLSIEELPPGARVATSSLRRKAQLLNFRPDLSFTEIRGNISTRLAKMEQQNLDALIIAAAGLKRLGMEEKITQLIPERICLPAVGQGALGIEGRAGDQAVKELVAVVDDPQTRLAVMAERSFLRRLGGGCQIPIAALGLIKGSRLELKGLVASTDGKQVIRGEKSLLLDSETAEQNLLAEKIGRELAESLLAQGAREILSQIGIMV